MKTYILLLAIVAGFAAVCTAAPCTPNGRYTEIHGSRAENPPALVTLNGALAAKAPPGEASYRMSVQRSDVATVCSLVKEGVEYKTYMPLKFIGGAIRMIKPVAENSGCQSAAKGTSPPSKLQLSFKLMDSAQVGVATCPATKSSRCPVYLYDSTGSPGYPKDTATNSTSNEYPKDTNTATTLVMEPGQGRKLSDSCDGDYFNCGCSCGTCACCGYPTTFDCPACAGSCGNCFPADVIVTTAHAGDLPISSLKIGDKVLAARPDGSTFFDDVYMFGHKDSTAASSFVKLETDSGAVLRLTADHHLFVTRAGQRLEIPSSKALVGDLVHVAGRPGASQLEAIASKSLVAGTGLFNPYTMSGSIVVDGVAASCHSSSALDRMFELVGVSVPDGYQTAFAPVRALYRVLGAERMASAEFIIDAVAVAANSGTSFSALAPVAASALAGGAWLATRTRAV